MTKQITCIECPVGCSLDVDIENCRVVKVTGNSCPKGELYAFGEVENPVRILTSSVLAEGLSLKMVPVRTTGPIPKKDISRAMDDIKKIRVTRAIAAGDVIVRNFTAQGVDLISTREVPAEVKEQ
jgi:CxxC motif-containing protein